MVYIKRRRSVTLKAVATHATYVSKRRHTSQRFTSLLQYTVYNIIRQNQAKCSQLLSYYLKNIEIPKPCQPLKCQENRCAIDKKVASQKMRKNTKICQKIVKN